MKTTLVRTAVLSGTTLLALGMAGPALACVPGAEWSGGAQSTVFSSPSHHTSSLTLAEYQAKIDAKLAKTLTRLAAEKAHIADSTTLTDAQKAAKTARVDALVTKLEALRVEVAAATSIKDIKADLKAAFAPDVADVKASLDARFARWLAKIDAWESTISANDSLDPAKKADKLATLQAWEDKLVALRAAIAADTTLAEVKADLKAADLRGLSAFGKHGFGHRHGHADGRGHDRSSDHRTKSDRTKTATVSFRFGSGANDSGRHGDGHRHGGGHKGHHHGHGGHGGRGHFA